MTHRQQEVKVNLESLAKMAVKDYLGTQEILNQVKPPNHNQDTPRVHCALYRCFQ